MILSKSLLATALSIMFFCFAAVADDLVIKECSVTMKNLESEQTTDMTMQIVQKSGSEIYAKVSQITNGTAASYNDTAVISDEKIREGLTSESDLEDMNYAEALIVHAMMLSEDPIFEGAYSAGFDLKNVRSAKLYTIGETTNMGSSTIVEARNSSGKVLGSFLGGFLVSPCK